MYLEIKIGIMIIKDICNIKYDSDALQHGLEILEQVECEKLFLL